MPADPEPVRYISSQRVALNFVPPNLEHRISSIVGGSCCHLQASSVYLCSGRREHYREHSHILHLLRQQEPLGYFPGGSTLYLLPPFVSLRSKTGCFHSAIEDSTLEDTHAYPHSRGCQHLKTPEELRAGTSELAPVE